MVCLGVFHDWGQARNGDGDLDKLGLQEPASETRPSLPQSYSLQTSQTGDS